MSEKKNDWTKSPWTIGIVTSAIVPFLLTVGYDKLKEKPILTTFFNMIDWVLNQLSLIINFELRLWWVIIFLLIIVVGNFFFRKGTKEGLSYSEIPRPEFINYKSDILRNWKWSWGWKLNELENKWHLSNLTAHCPNCDTPLIDQSTTYINHFECPRCDFNEANNDFEVPFKIERLIFDNICRKQQKKEGF
ncbi:hypothetical protein [Peijinzhouia sedimentorum]